MTEAPHEPDTHATPRLELARARRRQEALDSLEFEQQREQALLGRLEPIIRDAEAWRADELALAQVDPDDAATLTAIGFVQGRPSDESLGRIEAQITQLEEQVADSRRRQRAFEAYAKALED
ncbi:MAG: hypothetical protein U0R69_11150 [Gaiellales bacterium]